MNILTGFVVDCLVSAYLFPENIIGTMYRVLSASRFAAVRGEPVAWPLSLTGTKFSGILLLKPHEIFGA